MQWKKLTICLMMLSASGCTVIPNSSAICVSTESSRRSLAGALLTDGGPQSQRAGLLLLDQLRAGCRP